MITTRSTILTCAVIVLAPLAVLAQGADRSWEVRGRWVPYPGEDTSFGFHGSRAAAENHIAQLKRDYSPGGLLESAPNKPARLYIVDPTDGQTAPKPRTRSFMDAVYQKIERDKNVQNSLKDLGIGKTETGRFAAGLLTDPAKAYSEQLGEKAKTMLKDRGLEDFKNNVAGAYKRARDAKDELIGLTGSLADKNFKEVNGLVAKYNREASSPPPGLEPLGRMLPRMSPVGPDTTRQIGEWNQAVKQQFALERRKEELDRRKADLDSQRQKLADEWKALAADGKAPDPADPKVISLRKRLDRYREEADEYSTALEAYKSQTQKLLATIKRVEGRMIDLTGTRWARREGPRPALAAQNARVVIDFGTKGRWVHSTNNYVFGTWHQEGDRIVIDGFTYTGEPPRKLNFRATGTIDGETIKLDVVEDPYAPDIDRTPTKRVWIFDMMKK